MAALSGCATNTAAQFEAEDNAKCIGYGTKPGTPAYTDCRLKVEHQRALIAAATPLRAPVFKSCPTAASGMGCINPSAGR
jgi:hypothetical protein